MTESIMFLTSNGNSSLSSNVINCTLATNSSFNNSECSGGTHGHGGGATVDLLAYRVISVIFCIIVMLIGVSGNLFVIITFTSRWARLKTCEVFMIGLAFADWVGTIVIPLALILELLGIDFSPIGDFGCATIVWLQVTSVTVSAFALVAIAIDRFVIVLWPLKARLRQWKATVATVFIWVIASPVGIVYFFGKRNRLYHNGHGQYVCRTFWKTLAEDYIHTTATFIIQMILPIILMIILYTGIILELSVSKGAKLTEDSARVNEIRNRRNKKAIRLFLTIVFIFYFLVLPNNIFFLLYTFLHFPPSMTIFYTNAILNLVQMLNSCVNPIIYARLHTSFRRSALRMFCSCWFKRFKQYDWNTMSMTRRMSLRSRYRSRHNSASASPTASPRNGNGSTSTSKHRGSNSFLSPVLSTRVSVVSPSLKENFKFPSFGNNSNQQSLRVCYLREEDAVQFYSAPNPCYKLGNIPDDVFTPGTTGAAEPPTPTNSKYVRFSNYSATSEPKTPVVTAWAEKPLNGNVVGTEMGDNHTKEGSNGSNQGVLVGASEQETGSVFLKAPRSILKRGTSEEEELVRLDT